MTRGSLATPCLVVLVLILGGIAEGGPARSAPGLEPPGAGGSPAARPTPPAPRPPTPAPAPAPTPSPVLRDPRGSVPPPRRPSADAPGPREGLALPRAPSRRDRPGTIARPFGRLDASHGTGTLAISAGLPRLTLREPETTPSQDGPRIATVVLSRHSVSTRIVDGIAVTTLEQVYRNRGGGLGQGTWTCPLPAGAAVTAFSISAGGQEHTGRFLDRAEARRIYDEIVRKRMDPGIVELQEDGSVTVRIFPIPAGGEMGIRMTWVHPLPGSGSASHLLVALENLVPPDAPELESLRLSVQIETAGALRNVLTPDLALREEAPEANDRWRGTFHDEQCRPVENLGLGYVVDADAPRVTIHTEPVRNGFRCFVAVVRAGREPLHDVDLEIAGSRTADVYSAGPVDLAVGARHLVFGRLRDRGPVTATMRARVGREHVTCSARALNDGGDFVRALWGLRKIEAMQSGLPADEETRETLLGLAARFGILTRFNAILAEE